MNLADIKIKEEQPMKENGIELSNLDESSKETIFDILNLPELDKEGNKI